MENWQEKKGLSGGCDVVNTHYACMIEILETSGMLLVASGGRRLDYLVEKSKYKKEKV